MYRFFLKRLLDFIGALILLIFLFPIILGLTIFLFFANNGKPFFFQKRPGKDEKIFKVIKFKTMNDKTDSEGKLLSDGERLTKIGSFVRKTSLDELPQLFNVLFGQMSFIGPRPLLVRYLPFYTEKEKKRHNIRPGITGLAQISGRNLLGWDKRIALDVKYVEQLSFRMDMKIVITTIKNVLTSKDVVVDSTSVMLALDEERKQDK